MTTPQTRAPNQQPGLPPLEIWAGAECTINRVGSRYLDQSELSGHNRRPDDLDRFAGLGIRALRYPLLWESLAASPDAQAWWQWHDARLERLRGLGVRPILGLVHHGSGPPTTSLVSDNFAAGLAEHAGQAARRYPWVRDWTPVNEPLTTARFSALYGHWYPHERDERAFWSALLTQVEAVRAAMREIREVIPEARLIQTEDLGHTAATPERQAQADFDNSRRWASLDLLCGTFVPGHALWDHVAALGWDYRLRALLAAPCPPDILGINHYLTTDRFLDHRLDRHPPHTHGACPLGPLADTEAVRACASQPGLEGALRACWQRYGRPLAITEVHNGCTREEQMRWLAEAFATTNQLRGEGVPIAALTVWTLLGAYDWDSLLTLARGRYESGVFDARSDPPRETALAPLIRELAAGRPGDHPVLSNAGWWRGHRARGSADKRPLLIVGATGTLGQAFAAACRLRGIDFVLSARHQLDLTDPASIATALEDMRPWAVVNAAGWVRVDDAELRPAECLAVNCGGALALAQACAQRGIHYTCFSSDLVFDGSASRAYVESDPLGPLSVYGASKAQADAALQSAGQGALIIRTASFFSAFDQHNFAVHLADALRAGRPFAAVADCVTSPTYVPDLVRVTLDLIIDDETGLWHIVNDGAVTWAEFAHQIADALGLSAAPIEARAADAMDWLARRPPRAALTSERGLIMPTLTSGIERFAEELA